jgi:xylan 1,4-beta-xylosidase
VKQAKENIKIMTKSTKLICGALMWVFLLISATPVLAQSSNGAGIVFSPHWNEIGTPLKHTWEGLGNVDQFRWMVRGDMQAQLAMARRELNMRNVRAVGLFDDEMRVFGLDPQTWREKERKPRYNWQAIDYVIQSLLDRGISPVITTSFTPYAMASGEQYCFTTKANVTPPKDYNQWFDLVNKTVQHFVDRFGVATVKNWYFEVWNEPNLDAFWKGADKQEFYKLWTTTFKAIKAVNPGFAVGGPSTARAEWVEEFIIYTRANNCLPDFLITHVYNNDSPFAALSPFAGPQSDKVNDSPNFLSGVVKGTRRLLDSLGFKGELHFNEWGRSWHPSDEVRESQNEAAFIVKTMAECSQYADYFAYWCLSDIYDQLGYGAEAFHGNYGMMNLDGFKKPSYKAFQLLGKLGDRQVAIETNAGNVMQNAIASKSKNGYQFLFYAMEKDFKPGDKIKSTTVSVRLPEGVNAAKITMYKIGEIDNNIPAAWRKLGKPSYLNKEQLKRLKELNSLQKNTQRPIIRQTSDGKFLSVECEMPGVLFVEIAN